LILAGEAVAADDVTRWSDKVQVINAYGPAECGPIATVKLCTGDPAAGMEIGKEQGALTWVEDASNHNLLLAAGQIGELLLEGPLLADGYLSAYPLYQTFKLQQQEGRPFWSNIIFIMRIGQQLHLLRTQVGFRARHLDRLYSTEDSTRQET